VAPSNARARTPSCRWSTHRWPSLLCDRAASSGCRPSCHGAVALVARLVGRLHAALPVAPVAAPATWQGTLPAGNTLLNSSAQTPGKKQKQHTEHAVHIRPKNTLIFNPKPATQYLCHCMMVSKICALTLCSECHMACKRWLLVMRCGICCRQHAPQAPPLHHHGCVYEPMHTHQCPLNAAAAVGQRLATPSLLPAVAGPVGSVAANRDVSTVGLPALQQSAAGVHNQQQDGSSNMGPCGQAARQD
jgi:hypothetical protein